ncbi:WD40 repeat-like protein [Rhizoclosmatium globosum]|uniref:WD40 repeat-like protein n=1 Tax=Rhizoclosmatium globosum TaxID=329046 RepID=A0A1Y2C3W9_9FUNG|nr:WD40 repeat-like protein [Rhizoclosmatium globosum]|eukprot:ORY41587.1 WD40 repeat-like protein [Rhizoclosmatium globosum]
MSHRNTSLVRFRTLGIVCGPTPVFVNSLGSNGFFTAVAPLERSFQLFNVENLHLIFLSKEIPSKEQISCVYAHNEFTFAAAGTKIFIYKRADSYASARDNQDEARIFKLLVLGDLVIAAVSDNTVRIWNWATKEFVKTISFEPHFVVTTFIHPSTYVNKILVASADGRLQLWNFASLTMIYEFPSLSSPILTLAQSPAIDVIAIGTQDGRILLKDIKTNVPIKQFYQESQSPVTAISFRSDDDSPVPMMASGGADGSVFIWDLEKNVLVVRVAAGEGDAHGEAVHTAQFLSGQPVLVTASGDNSIKEWIFDNDNGHPRLWKSRSGHRDPPNRIRFVGPDPTTIISSGSDGSLRKYSTIQDQRNLEFSRKNAESKKFSAVTLDGRPNPIIHFDACESGVNDWDDIITVEANSHLVKTWRLKRGAIGKHQLAVTDKTPAKVRFISPCGNFVFVGSAKGGIDMYNIQSGHLKGTFPTARGHSKAIVGLAADSLSEKLVSASLDGTVKIWGIKKRSLLETITFSVPVSGMTFHKESNIAAVACDDLCVRIIDIEVGKVVREFWGHRNRILDMSLSPDSRWLLTSGLEGNIKLWDIPSSTLIGSLRVDPATSVSFSVDGNYIATSHVNNRGVVLWANTTLFDISSSAIPVDLRVPEEEDDDLMNTGRDDSLTLNEEDDPNNELIRLSSLPLSRVQLLLNLESIQKRRKPAEKLQKPDNVPFFLGALGSTSGDTSFKAASFDFVEANTDVSKRLIMDFNDSTADWHVEYLDTLLQLSPSALDLEIRSFGPSDFEPFLDILLQNSSNLSNYEFVQCVLSIFLEAHGSDLILETGKHVQKKLNQVKDSVAASWRVLEDLFHANLAVLEHLRT